MKPIKAWAVLTQNGKNIAEIFYLAAHDMPMAIYRDKQNRRGGDVQAYQWVHVEIRELERPTRRRGTHDPRLRGPVRSGLRPAVRRAAGVQAEVEKGEAMSKPVNRCEVQVVFPSGGYHRYTTRKGGVDLFELESFLKDITRTVQTARAEVPRPAGKGKR